VWSRWLTVCEQPGANEGVSTPFANNFGCIAVIAPIVLQFPEAGTHSAAAAPCFSASPSLVQTGTHNPVAKLRTEHPTDHRAEVLCVDRSFDVSAGLAQLW
jgi:hypothetical protein